MFLYEYIIYNRLLSLSEKLLIMITQDNTI